MTQIFYKIKRVQVVEFFLDEEKYLGGKYTYTVESLFKSTLNSNLLDFYIHFEFDNLNKENDPFCTIKVKNVFEIENLEDFRIKENTFDIPERFASVMMGLGISHSRAMFFQLVGNSSISHITIPVMNPKNILDKLYGRQ